jgi:hypothetical protein
MTSVIETWVARVRESLEAGMTGNAIFLAERIAAQWPDRHDIKFLLAQCYSRDGQPEAVYQTLRTEMQHLPSCYLFAKTCFDMNKLQESENALLSLLEGLIRSNLKLKGTYFFAQLLAVMLFLSDVPHTAFIHCLLGMIYKLLLHANEVVDIDNFKGEVVDMLLRRCISIRHFSRIGICGLPSKNLLIWVKCLIVSL